jgi:hypothetical protein
LNIRDIAGYKIQYMVKIERVHCYRNIFCIFVTFFFGDLGAVSVLLQSLVRVYLPIPYNISAGNWGSTWKYLSSPASASYISVLLQSDEHVRGSLDPAKERKTALKNKRKNRRIWGFHGARRRDQPVVQQTYL